MQRFIMLNVCKSPMNKIVVEASSEDYRISDFEECILVTV